MACSQRDMWADRPPRGRKVLGPEAVTRTALRNLGTKLVCVLALKSSGILLYPSYNSFVH